MEYSRPLSVNGLGSLTQQEQYRSLNSKEKTTQAISVKTSFLKGVKQRPIEHDFQPSSLIFSGKGKPGYNKCEKKLLISQPSNRSITWRS